MAQLKPGWSRVIDPLHKVMTSFHIRPVKSMKFVFDPYHPNVRSMRESLFLLKLPKIIKTNLNCSTKVDIKSDRCEPEIQISFIDDHQLLFKTANLTTLDILEKFRELCDAKDPKKDEPVNLLTMKKDAKKRKK